MKHVFIIGSRGYHAKYGGWETFVSKLVDNYNDKDTIFYISSLSDTLKNEYKVNDNIIVKPIYVKEHMGRMLFCTIKALNYYLKYIEKHDIKNAYIYILGLKLGPVLKFKKNKIKRLGVTTIINPDGLEYKRSKWGPLVKKFFLLSEKWMLNSCDLIVCDALGIQKYINSKYPKLKNKTTYIAYGTDKINLNNVDTKSILKEYNLDMNNYLLIIGRFVPENNYELIIKSYMKSTTKKELIIISNISMTNYYNTLVKNTNCLSDKRIHFIDGVYDEIKLSVIRKNAYAYIHGHSVGGTNPSLLEALSLTDLNILYDVEFNKDVGRDSCLYFKNEDDLVKILDNLETFDKEKMGASCKEIIKNNFTWNIIVKKYKKIFK